LASARRKSQEAGNWKLATGNWKLELDYIQPYAIVRGDMVSDDDIAAFLPLSTQVFHVIVALADEDKHGYAIIKDIALRTDGAERLGAGTLYAILKRLLDDDLIVEVQGGDAASDDQRRRYYRLTPLGRKVARAEVARLERASAMARSTRLFGRTRQV
jgi:DNA-binding PadR family transcriptional regulator